MRNKANALGYKHFAIIILLATSDIACNQANTIQPCNPSDLHGCVIESIELTNTQGIETAASLEKIATTETSHIFGGALRYVPILGAIDALTVDYEHFNRFVLERDLERIERYFRARGYYEAKVQATRIHRLPNDHVRVEIVVEQGPAVQIETVELAWKDWQLPTAAEVTKPVVDAKNRLIKGIHFDEDQFEATKKNILKALTDRGFAYAQVGGHANIDLAKHIASIAFDIELGPKCQFGEVTLVGVGELPESLVRTAIEVHPGETYSTAQLETTELALNRLGVFATISIEPQRLAKADPNNTIIPVTIRVEPSKLRSAKLGIGAELGSRLEAHLLGGWETRNFLGGMGRLTVEAKPGLVFYPTRLDTLLSEAPTNVLPEVKLRMEYRQPIPIPQTSIVAKGAFNVYRLDTSQVTTNVSDANIYGYREYAGTIGVERSFFMTRLDTGVYLNIQQNDPFSYNLDEPPEGFFRVVIPSVETSIALDLRKGKNYKFNSIHPHRGIYVATDVQMAGHVLGGDTSDVRLRPEFRSYFPITRKLTLGVRFTMGILFPSNYGTTLDETDPCGELTGDEQSNCEKDAARDLQLLQFRGFFSGGPNSNRGYGYNEVGPYGIVPSLYPGTSNDAAVPTGGLSLWESSLELRFPIVGKFGTVVFTDASDVTRATGEYRLTHPHLSTGFGLRYETPVGPFRLDAGYRIACMQVVGECGDLPIEEGTQGTIFGAPIAVSVAIGEAF